VSAAPIAGGTATVAAVGAVAVEGTAAPDVAVTGLVVGDVAPFGIAFIGVAVTGVDVGAVAVTGAAVVGVAVVGVAVVGTTTAGVPAAATRVGSGGGSTAAAVRTDKIASGPSVVVNPMMPSCLGSSFVEALSESWELGRARQCRRRKFRSKPEHASRVRRGWQHRC
jgi:hypothetical protein